MPPEVTAPWYRRDRPCAYCVGKVLRRRELNPPIIEVLHEKECPAVTKEMK
jgi:hypothetical protein